VSSRRGARRPPKRSAAALVASLAVFCVIAAACGGGDDGATALQTTGLEAAPVGAESAGSALANRVAAGIAAGLARRNNAFVVVSADAIEVIQATAGNHFAQPAIVRHNLVGAIRNAGWRGRGADYQGSGVGSLDLPPSPRQHPSISRSADLAAGPLAVKVGLVPYFDGVGALPGDASQPVRVGIDVTLPALRQFIGSAHGADQDLEAVITRAAYFATHIRRAAPVETRLNLHPGHAGGSHRPNRALTARARDVSADLDVYAAGRRRDCGEIVARRADGFLVRDRRKNDRRRGRGWRQRRRRCGAWRCCWSSRKKRQRSAGALAYAFALAIHHRRVNRIVAFRRDQSQDKIVIQAGDGFIDKTVLSGDRPAQGPFPRDIWRRQLSQIVANSLKQTGEQILQQQIINGDPGQPEWQCLIEALAQSRSVGQPDARPGFISCGQIIQIACPKGIVMARQHAAPIERCADKCTGFDGAGLADRFRL